MEHLLSRFGQTYKERIARAVLDITSGKGVLVVDNENRENEGDLIFSAEKMTVKDMALTIRECSGIVCLCITAEHAAKLNLQYMVADNSSKYQTPFTVTIEAREGVTTGVSAADRIQTIKTAIADGVVPADLARPGHVFPLIANADGVLGREGHTEGSIDLMKIAGLKPAAVLCELTNEDGTMAKLPELISFAEKHEIIVISIEDIICYRKNHE